MKSQLCTVTVRSSRHVDAYKRPRPPGKHSGHKVRVGKAQEPDRPGTGQMKECEMGWGGLLRREVKEKEPGGGGGRVGITQHREVGLRGICPCQEGDQEEDTKKRCQVLGGMLLVGSTPWSSLGQGSPTPGPWTGTGP